MDCGATERILEQRACEVLNSIRRMWRPGILVVKLGRFIIYLIGISSHERNIINVFSKVIFKTNFIIMFFLKKTRMCKDFKYFKDSYGFQRFDMFYNDVNNI